MASHKSYYQREEYLFCKCIWMDIIQFLQITLTILCHYTNDGFKYFLTTSLWCFFSRGVRLTGLIRQWLMCRLEEDSVHKGWATPERAATDALVRQYHSGASKDMEAFVTSNFGQPETAIAVASYPPLHLEWGYPLKVYDILYIGAYQHLPWPIGERL